jgi:hypothetical protein
MRTKKPPMTVALSFLRYAPRGQVAHEAKLNLYHPLRLVSLATESRKDVR